MLIPINVMAVTDLISQFDDAGLHPIVLSNVKKCGYAAPLPIQAYVVPLVNMGHDVVAISQTGEQSTRHHH